MQVTLWHIREYTLACLSCIKRGWICLGPDQSIHSLNSKQYEPLSFDKLMGDFNDVFTGLGCLPGCSPEGGSDCKHAAVEAIVDMLQPGDKRAVQCLFDCHLPFQFYPNAFWSVWTTAPVDGEKQHSLCGKVSKKHSKPSRIWSVPHQCSSIMT